MGISPTQLLVIVAIVALLFGSKKLRGLGSDLGRAIKGFKDELDQDQVAEQETLKTQTQQRAEIAIDKAHSA